MEIYDNFSYDKCTCSKKGMTAFGQAYLSYKKLSYVKLLVYTAWQINLTSFTKSQTSEHSDLAWLGFSRQLMFILMAASRTFESSQVTSVLLEALQSRKSQWNSKSERRNE